MKNKVISGIPVSFFKNFTFVSVSQFGNYVLPLITIPYLTRTLGPEKFGLISFAQVFISYFTIIVNFGFDLTITRKISVNRNNPEKISEIFSHTLLVKFLLFLGSSLILACLLFIAKFRSNASLYLVTHLINIGYLLFPLWLFQGMEKSGFSAMLNFCIKLIFSISVFILIRSEKDYILSNLLLSLAQIFVGCISLVISARLFGIQFRKPEKTLLWSQLKEGFWIFLSMAIISGYTTSNMFLLGLLKNDQQVGYFNIAYKIIFSVYGLILIPFNYSFFPIITKQFFEDRRMADKALRRIGRYLILIMLIASVLLFLLSDFIIAIFGSGYTETSMLLKLMSVLPVGIALVNLYGFNGLVALGMDRKFMLVTGLGAAISIILNLLLIPLYGMYAVAVVWGFTEFFIFSMSLYFYNKATRVV